MSIAAPNERVLRFDVFELDVRTGELRKRGVRQRLQGQPLQVLEALLKRAGDLVTREELRAEIWAADTFVDFDHSLHNAIARIRETLGDSAENPRFIETLPRRGYRFLDRVEEVGEETTSAHVKGSPAQIQSLAVLPLDDHSSEPGHEYFADGMTEALITSLAKIKALRVISRTSAMQYKGARKSLPQIARELNVDAVVEGSVLRSGNRVRIAAQLIHAATDRHLWAESYERDFQDVLSLQSEIARQVAEEVRVTLTPQERARIGSSPRVNPEAHEQYLMGRFHWNKRSEASVRKALDHFQRAIAIDPTSAPGHAGVGDCYAILGYYSWLAPSDAYGKARAAALKALSLDDSLAEPHTTLAIVKRDFEWDWAGAEEEFQLALGLNPGYVEVFHWRSTMLSLLGRHEEAMVEKKKALSLDPLSVVIATDLARSFYFNRQYDRAIDQYRKALELDPHFSSAYLWMAQPYQQKGHHEDAMAALQTGSRLAEDSAYALARVGHGYAVSGRSIEAREVLDRLNSMSKQRYVSPYDLAIIYLGLGENDRAIACLQQALEERSPWIGYLGAEPQMDVLRPDRRFQQLLQQAGLAR
jgi:TolB-like protein/Tfp pilus assembly protein PilF